MTLRKGQHLFNEISKRYDLENLSITRNGNQELYPYVNLHNILFQMTDKEFEQILQQHWPLMVRSIGNSNLHSKIRDLEGKIKNIQSKTTKIRRYYIKQKDNAKYLAFLNLYDEFIHDLDDLLETLENKS